LHILCVVNKMRNFGYFNNGLYLNQDLIFANLLQNEATEIQEDGAHVNV